MLNRSLANLSVWALLWLLSARIVAAEEFHLSSSTSYQAPVTARIIVKFRPEASLARRDAMAMSLSRSEEEDGIKARAHALSSRSGIPLTEGRAISEHAQVVFGTGLTEAEILTRLGSDPEIEYAVVDQKRARTLVPNDPYFVAGPPLSGSTGGPAVGQWYLQAPSGEILSSINASDIWEYITGDPAIVVAVLDTGIAPDHPDLIGRLLPGYDMVSDIATANDGDGRDDDPSDPGDWVTVAEASDRTGGFFRCDVSDSSWHGTQTASLIGAASNNDLGMTGLAWGVGILPVRVLGKCGGYDSDIIAGMNWAAGLHVPGVPDNPAPAKVVNLSLGSSGDCPRSYTDAINTITTRDNPAVIVVSAGNSTGLAVTAPGNCSGVIAVAGLRHSGTKVGYSDLGPEIAISAPAGNCVNTDVDQPCLYPILAASNDGRAKPAAATYTDSFNSTLGTSFSAPLVSGTVALMLSINPDLTPSEITARLQSSARPFPVRSGNSDPIPDCHAPSASSQSECYCTTTTCGAGMLDTFAAVMAVGPFPVYRFSNSISGGHFFTISEAEKNAVINNYDWYKYEGIGFHAYPSQQSGTLPIYRFFNNNAGGHFFTISEEERNVVINNYDWYKYEGTGFHAYPSQQSGTLPVYRFFNNNVGGHFFTISESEKRAVIDNYPWFRYEGVGYYASP